MQNRPTLAQFARHLRTHQTDCEHLLWQKLRARQVVRFNNLEVIQQMGAVLEQIIKTAAERKAPSP